MKRRSSPETARMPVPRPERYRRTMWAINLGARAVGGIRVSGVGNLPDGNNPYMLAVVNHPSILEPPVVAAALYDSTGDQAHFLATDEIGTYSLHKGLLKFDIGRRITPFIESCGAITITRHKRLSPAAQARLDEVVDGNGIIGIFPEGDFTHGADVAPLERGVGMIAARYGLAIVPVGVAGTDYRYERDSFGPFNVHFAEPLPVSQSTRPVHHSRLVMPELQDRLQAALTIAREQHLAST